MPVDIKVLKEAINRAFPVTHLEIHDESSGCGERYSIILVSEVRHEGQLSFPIIIKQ
jgi:stress-induced morphogen